MVVGCVFQVNQDDKTVSINILIPHGPSQSYRYPAKERVIMVSTDNIFTKIDPRTSYGQIYTMYFKRQNQGSNAAVKLYVKNLQLNVVYA